MNILIVGDVDFLGFETAKALAADGDRRVVLFGQCGRSSLQKIGLFPSIEVVLSDTDNEYALRTAFSALRPDVVFLNVPKGSYSTHMLTVYLVLEIIKLYPPKHLMLRSSYEVYEPCRRYKPLPEKTPCHPTSLYGAASLASETLARISLDGTGIVHSVLRFAEIYGFEVRPTGIVPAAIKTLLSGKTLGVRNGRDVLDFIDVRDAAGVVNRCVREPVPGVTVNVGSSEVLQVSDVVKNISARLGQKNRVVFRPPLSAHRVPLDINQLLSFYTPSRRLDDGLDSIIADYKDSND